MARLSQKCFCCTFSEEEEDEDEDEDVSLCCSQSLNIKK